MCLIILFHILLFATSVLCSDEPDLKRHITCVIHTDKENEYNLNVIHVTAANENDKIHYLWSSYYLPSVIIARTTKDTILEEIDFDKLRAFQSDAIKFSQEPLASTGLTISELWQYSYDSDTSEVNDISSTISLGLELFHWQNITNSSISCTDQFAVINLISSGDGDTFSKNGTFEIEFSVAGEEISASEYPHLIYTGNSTQLKVVFNQLHSNSSRVRYAMEISVFAPYIAKCSVDECNMEEVKSVSDEFSPGIFTDITLLPPCSHDSFLSWRPVAYTSRKPIVVNSTDAEVTSKCSKTVVSDPQSIAQLFFHDKSNFSASAFNITFGSKGDGFYPKTKYTMWSFMAGVGSSVGFSLSITAIIIVSIGMGAILLFILCGLTFVGVQKCLRKDDELLLANNHIN